MRFMSCAPNSVSVVGSRLQDENEPMSGAPQTIDRFDIIRKLGAGGMGIVYEARQRETGELVALKTLPKVDAGSIYLLKQEFRSLANVVHPNLVGLYELVSSGTRYSNVRCWPWPAPPPRWRA